MGESSAACVFCDIVNEKIPAEIVYQDQSLIAFRDANPAAPVHILVVPRKHIPTLNDIGPDDTILSDIGRAAAKIAADFGVAQSGYRFVINVNRGGGQVIFHLHAHLVSRSAAETQRSSEK